MNNNSLTIAQVLVALRRHKLKAFFTWFLMFSVIMVLFVVWPRKYGSEGRMYIQVGRNNSSITPGTGSGSITVQDTRETEIRSVVEIIKSRAVLEAVVDDIGSDVILKNKWSDMIPAISFPKVFGSKSGPDGMSIEEYNSLKEREVATRTLEQALTVSSEKKTSIISIFVKASSAKLAQQIVNRVFEHTRKVHLSIHAAEGSAVFFDERFDEQEQDLVKAVSELAKFRNEKKVLSVGAARSALQDVIGMVSNNLVTAEVAYEEADNRLKELQRMIDKTSEKIEMPTKGMERLSYEDSRTELFKLETERERLSATYRSGHPELDRVESQVKMLRRSLSAMNSERTESQFASNPVYEALKVDALRAQADKVAAHWRVEALKSKERASEDQLEEMNQAEVESDQLQRDVDIARQYLAIYTQKRGESKALSLFDDRKISDVVVAQKANFNVKHVSPRGSLILPLAFIAGLLAALGTVLFCERNHLSGTLNEGEVEQVLDLPVLVTLPRVYSSRNMVN